MRCVWCDSEYTFTGGEYFTLDDVVKRVRALDCKLVEVTGGEPLAQREAFTLIGQLCNEGFEVLVETGGFVSTADVDPRARIILDIKCPASGEEARNHWPNIEHLRADKDEVKFVIVNYDDWLYALETIRRYELDKRTKAILISPAWGALDLKDMAEWVTASGLDVRMQLQLHKYIWGPEARGV
jgi:7-carboxy-7-deazaguanine synthase